MEMPQEILSLVHWKQKRRTIILGVLQEKLHKMN
jgi:hypothetical protein